MEFKRFEEKVALEKRKELFRDAFPETEGTSIESNEHYFWKFHSFPGKSKSFEFAAYEEDRLIGYYAAIPYQYRINGEIVSCGMVCDVMTHSSMRGKGVFTKIGIYSLDSLKTEGIAFTSGYPIRPEVIPGHIKVGWKIAFDLPLYIHFLSLSKYLSKNLFLKFLSLPINLGIYLYNNLFSFFNQTDKNIQIDILSPEEFFKNEKEYKEFLKNWESEIPNTLIKNIEFLRWRLGAPDSEYKILKANCKEKMVGVSVLRKTELKGISTIAVLDLMVLKEFYSASSTILNSIKRYAKSVNVETIVMMVSKNWAGRYRLIKNGFLKTPFLFKLILNPLVETYNRDSFFSEENWHLMWIDSDDL